MKSDPAEVRFVARRALRLHPPFATTPADVGSEALAEQAVAGRGFVKQSDPANFMP